ncbi:NAD(P)-binding protein [Marinobacterium sp. AK62]|uniref:NAD(P)-binding protein n=1 Tax=Marinobacterium alkalitolerans TaxID=1542925 RepID=A0ABS3ZCT2_9GAMM|nr:FAD-dependent oxidoreductase [Marinobacterium alkalitolerans]MBP0049510.1 NAD(P)-binding protein [Marinobacterium alkalitolerans]
MHSNKERVAVVGAGLSGVLVARGLHEQGWQVEVFEKSRGSGGRLASARLGEGAIDLGAAALTELQRQHLLALAPEAEGLLQAWDVQLGQLDGQRSDRVETLHVPGARSSALTRGLLDGVPLHTAVRVGAMQPAGQGGWSLEDDQGRALGTFEKVVIATPAPQAVPLLRALPELSAWAAAHPMFPQWVLILTTEQPLPGLDGMDWLEGAHPVLSRVIRNGAKPGRDPGQWVLQASREWSAARVEASAEAMAQELMAAFNALCGETVNVAAMRAHRWLYAGADPSAMPVPPSDSVQVCGDWTEAGGSGIEAAIDSARRVLSHWS